MHRKKCSKANNCLFHCNINCKCVGNLIPTMCKIKQIGSIYPTVAVCLAI